MIRGDSMAVTEQQTRRTESAAEHEGSPRHVNGDEVPHPRRPSPSTDAEHTATNGSSSTSPLAQNAHESTGSANGVNRSREERSEAAKRGWATRRSKDAYK